MKSIDTTTSHDVMACPACKSTITATVHLSTELGRPEINADGTVTVTPKVKMTRFHVTHHCGGRVEVERPTDA